MLPGRIPHRCCLAWCLIGGMLSSARSDDAAEQDSKTAAAAIETVEVERRPLRVDVTLSGVFEAPTMVEVRVETEEWRTLEVIEALSHGSVVRQGDTLIRFETEDLDRELERARTDVELGRLSILASQLDLELQEKTHPLELEAAERRLREAREDWEYYQKVGEQQTVRSSEMSLFMSRVNLESAQEELKQLEQMYLADDLTEETEEIILKRARQDVEIREYYLENAMVSHDLLMQFNLSRQRLQLENQLRRSELEGALTAGRLRASLETARITLQQLQLRQRETEERLMHLMHDREQLHVVAPVAGRVMYGECRRGSWSRVSTMLETLRPKGSVSPDQVLLTIVPQEEMLFVRTDVKEADLRYLVRPHEVAVIPTINPLARWSALPRTFDPIAIDDDVYDATFFVTPGETPVELLPGMTCQVIVTGYHNPEALTLPEDVIFDHPTQPGRKVVYLQTPDGHTERGVELGPTSQGRTEILSGLEEGDRVLKARP